MKPKSIQCRALSAFAAAALMVVSATPQQALAQACGNLLSTGPVISPVSGSKVIVGQTISITRFTASSAGGNCIFRNGVAYYAHPDGNVVQTMSSLNLNPGCTISCPGSVVDPVGCTASVTCLAFPTTYVVNAADKNRPLSIVMPPRGQFPGDTALLSGNPNQVRFFGSGNVDGFDPANPQNATGAGFGSSFQFLIVVNPGIRITKECVTTCPPPIGNSPYNQPIQFRGTISNTGDVDLVNIAVSDVPVATIAFAATTSLGNPFSSVGPSNRLRPNESVNYTGSYVPAGAGVALCGPFSDTVTVTANADGVFQSPQVSNQATATCTVCTAPCIDVVKECLTPVVQAGQPALYRIRVRNCGDVPLQNVVLRDDSFTPGNTADDVVINIPGQLAPGAFFPGPTAATWITNSVTTTAAQCAGGGFITNTVVATGANICPPPQTQTVTDTDRCAIRVVCPGITISKQCVDTCPDLPGDAVYGQLITVRSIVCNTSDVPVLNITITNTPAGGTPVLVANIPVLNPGQCATNTFSYAAPANPCGPFTDTVTARGIDQGVTATASATCTVCTAPCIDVVKECLTPVVQAGQPALYRIRVRNCGDVPLQNVVLRDDSFTPGNTADDVVINIPGQLAPGAFFPGPTAATWITNSVTTTAAQCAGGGFITNTVVATGVNLCPPPQTQNVQDADRCAIRVVCPGITISKQCVDTCPDLVGDAVYGQPITVRTIVCNTSAVPVLNITITNTPAGGTPTLVGNIPVLNPGECATNTFSYAPPGNPCGPFTDTVTARGIDQGVTASATATCTVCTAPAIDVTKECLDPVVLAGTPARYRVRVQNTGNVPLLNVTMVDNSATPGNAADDVTIPVGTLAPLAFSAWFTNSVPTSEADCPINNGTRENTVVATGANSCNPAQTVSDTARCNFRVTCIPCIRITEEVVCVKPDTTCDPFTAAENDQITACGMRNENSTDCSAFCFKITIQAVCIDGTPSQVPVSNIVVTSRLNISGCNFPTYLLPGTSFSCIIPRVTLCTNFTDIVTVVGTGPDGLPVPPDADDTDSVSVTIKPIAVSCNSTLTSSIDLDNGISNCVTLPNGTIAAPLTLTTTITNESDVDLDVTVANLPPLVNCGDQVTPIVITQPIAIPRRGTYVITGCVISDCVETNWNITVSGSVKTNGANTDCACFYNRDGKPIKTSANANDICPVCIDCIPAVTCRVTGGGQLIPGFVDQSCIQVATTIYPFETPSGLTIKKITHGGQLGAPFSQMDCGAVLGNPCIRGQWSHHRHYEGHGNPRDEFEMNFHSTTPKGIYDSLYCACLGCCDPDTGAFIPPVVGPLVKKYQICNPDDHKVCGPQPRPAPANVIIWSGVGKVTPTDDISGPRADRTEWVVFRIYIEDRSEPGGGHPGGSTSPADIYCFQAWKTGIKTSKKPDFNTIATAFRAALGQANCDFVNALESGALPIGSLPSPTVNGLTADIQDCGPMHDGNHQIHPSTGATCNE